MSEIAGKCLKKRGRGNPNWRKGVSGNPGGLTVEDAQAKAKLNAALCGEWQEIHEALMKLVREGNAPAVIYAHKRVAGEATSASERAQESDEDVALDALTNEEARTLLALRLKVSDAAKAKAVEQAARAIN